MKRIVTIQDIYCVGKCSLTVALPVLSAAGGCVAGGAAGALLLKKLPSNIVAFVFALIMIGVGVKLTFFRG